MKKDDMQKSAESLVFDRIQELKATYAKQFNAPESDKQSVVDEITKSTKLLNWEKLSILAACKPIKTRLTEEDKAVVRLINDAMYKVDSDLEPPEPKTEHESQIAKNSTLTTAPNLDNAATATITTTSDAPQPKNIARQNTIPLQPLETFRDAVTPDTKSKPTVYKSERTVLTRKLLELFYKNKTSEIVNTMRNIENQRSKGGFALYKTGDEETHFQRSLSKNPKRIARLIEKNISEKDAIDSRSFTGSRMLDQIPLEKWGTIANIGYELEMREKERKGFKSNAEQNVNDLLDKFCNAWYKLTKNPNLITDKQLKAAIKEAHEAVMKSIAQDGKVPDKQPQNNERRNTKVTPQKSGREF